PVLLLLILGASSTMFVLLVRRWTTQRYWLAMGEWAVANGFEMRVGERAGGPEILGALTKPSPKVHTSLNDADTWLVQIETSTEAGTRVSPQRWNLLFRKLTVKWPTTGLRP